MFTISGAGGANATRCVVTEGLLIVAGRLGTQLPRVLGTVALGLALSCASGSGRSGRTQGVVFPEYSAEAAVLFDDVLAPALFGFDPQARTPEKDPKLRGRTQNADFVLPVRVESLSKVGAQNQGAYEITLAPTGRALAGEHTGPVVIQVPMGGPSYAWVDGAGASWAGSRLIIFGKAFRQGEGSVLHFRGEPDTPEVRKAIERDAGLRWLR